MVNNLWKKMGYRQIISGLHYLEKVNPSSESTGKGVLMIIQGAQFMFGIDSAKYLKDTYKATGSNSELASTLGDLYSNDEWRKKMWQFVEINDPDFKNVAKKMADQKKIEKKHRKHDVMVLKFLSRYPHLSELEQQIQDALIKGGQSFAKTQSDKKSPLNEINVDPSQKKMDVFVAKVEVRQPKDLITSKKDEYAIFNVYVNIETDNFKFTDNDVIYSNYCKKSNVEKNSHHTPFNVTGKFKEIVNLQPFFMQYLILCNQQYKKYGFK